MMEERKVVFYCSASYDIDPKYNEAAREVTRAVCSLGWTIVSGGTVKGTMGVVADTVVECGGKHIGILPRFMEKLECAGLAEVVWAENMDERKSLLRRGTKAAVALPGGIGTLDELIGTLTEIKLNQYDGRLFALDVDGFYTPLKSLLDHYVATGMLDARSRELIEFPKTAEELIERLKSL